jgi:Ala-tRNA(Pro) deacylase
MFVDQFLDAHRLHVSRFKHAAANTCAEFKALVPSLSGTHNKNLFLQDKKGRRHFLVVTQPESEVDLVKLGEKLAAKKLGFASVARLKHFLGVEPGAVSVLALMRDTETKVELIIDKHIWQAKAIQAHPLINTETLVIEHKELQRFLKITGHAPKIMNVPVIEPIFLANVRA